MANEDFDIDQLATYLHLTPQQVSRMAERGKLPARRVAGQWRFSQADIHHWLEDRIGASDEDELIEVEEVLQRADRDSGDEPVSIGELLPLEAISVSLSARSQNSVITAMVELAARTGLLWDPDKMADAVRARENLHPTALDSGVALLHPRRPMAGILAEPFLALGRTPKGIPFGGSRGTLTDVFFLLCSVDDRGHLRALARLSRLVNDSTFLAALRQLDDPAALHQYLADFERQLPG